MDNKDVVEGNGRHAEPLRFMRASPRISSIEFRGFLGFVAGSEAAPASKIQRTVDGTPI